MKYALLITQTADGESTVTAVDAEGKFYDGVLILHYIFDGAEYCLEIGGKEMSQLRTGAIKMFMRFSEGRTTVAQFGDGINGGEFPVFTRKLEVKFDGADCNVSCEFSYGEGGEAVNLSVSATVLQ